MLHFSDKAKLAVNDRCKVLCAEGTTASGKTTQLTLGGFMIDVMESPKKLHVLMGKTTGVVEKNIINSDTGIIDVWGSVFKYFGNGSKNYKFPHLITEGGEKVIVIIGYDNVTSCRNILGSQFGVAFVDEGNTANIETLRELATRCDKIYFTNNPDNPDLPYFTEFVNKCVDMTPNDTPSSIQEYLTGERENWHYYFFNFYDNPIMTEEKIADKKSMLDPKTKIYRNKILGERCKAVGLIFNLEPYMLTRERPQNIVKYICGVDTSYSQKSDDWLTAVMCGLTADGKLIVLDAMGHNNNTGEHWSPSDFVKKLHTWITTNYPMCRECYIDSADQGTILEAKKIPQSRVQYVSAYKKVPNVERINMMNGWLWDNTMMIFEPKCKPLIGEMNLYSWQEGKDIPEDANDHFIQACEYAWLPYRDKIGNKKLF